MKKNKTNIMLMVSLFLVAYPTYSFSGDNIKNEKLQEKILESKIPVLGVDYIEIMTQPQQRRDTMVKNFKKLGLKGLN